jgi:hypothetical protein
LLIDLFALSPIARADDPDPAAEIRETDRQYPGAISIQTKAVIPLLIMAVLDVSCDNAVAI